MPIRAEMRRRYPKDWKRISAFIRRRACDACEGCGARNGRPHPITGSKVVLTVAHLDHQPENNAPANLRAWCQKCHNAHDLLHRIMNRRRRHHGMDDLFLSPPPPIERLQETPDA